MIEVLEQNGWNNYKIGCPCQGRPKYFSNEKVPGTIIIIKGDTFTVRQYGVEVCRGNSNNFNSKMNDNGIVKQDI